MHSLAKLHAHFWNQDRSQERGGFWVLDRRLKHNGNLFFKTRNYDIFYLTLVKMTIKENQRFKIILCFPFLRNLVFDFYRDMKHSFFYFGCLISQILIKNNFLILEIFLGLPCF